MRRPHVIVMAADPGNSLIEAARDMGAIVIVGDPADDARLRSLMTRRSWVWPRTHDRWVWPKTHRVTLRRMYIISNSTQLNQRVARAAERVLQPDYLPHRQGVVPRILVRFEDTWQGWAFRNASLTRHRWVLDPGGGVGRTTSAIDTAVPEYLAVPSAPSGQPIVDGITPMDLVSQQLVEEMIPRNDPGNRTQRVQRMASGPYRPRRVIRPHGSPS